MFSCWNPIPRGSSKAFHTCEAQCTMWFGYLGKQANMSSTQNSLLLKKFGEKKGKDASSRL